MSRQVSRSSPIEYQADEQAGVELSKGKDQMICCCDTQIAKTSNSPEVLFVHPLKRSSKALGHGENWGVSLTTGLEESARCQAGGPGCIENCCP